MEDSIRMVEDIYWLGPCPAHEDAVQIGDPDYARLAKAQCRAYIEAIRAVLGHEPDGARLSIVAQNHDFGTYYEVVCRFDGNDPVAADFATRCDEQAPATWAEAGVSPPNQDHKRSR